jgi:hypothetical protein
MPMLFAFVGNVYHFVSLQKVLLFEISPTQNACYTEKVTTSSQVREHKQ